MHELLLPAHFLVKLAYAIWLNHPIKAWFSAILAPNAVSILVTALCLFIIIVKSARKKVVPQRENGDRAIRLLAGYSSDFVLGIEVSGRITFAAPSVGQTLGYSNDELIGQSCFNLMHPEDWLPLQIALQRDASDVDGFTFNHRLRYPDGSFVWFESRCHRVREGMEESGEQVDIFMIAKNVSCLLHVEAKLEAALHQLDKLARVDALTGIPNRRWFDDTMSTELLRATRTGLPVSLVITDIDRLSFYNETEGTPAGDHLLQRIATIVDLSGRRPGDFSARYSGGSFALLLPETDIAGAALLAEEIRTTAQELAVPLNGDSTMTVSIGLACVLPNRRGSRVELVAAAERAVKAAKQAGRNAIRVAPIRPDHTFSP